MALQGTIRDFGLADILQLIGIQRKTGVLTMENGEETVTVKFLSGQIVGADTKQRSVEELLGAVLVRTGRITEKQLREALAVQRKSLQRLGYVLIRSGMISEEDLIDALRVQSLQIVYRLFRWRSGNYHFDATDHLEYDEKHFEPISAETILMEGARMIDEWPIIERRIKSDRMIFRRSAAAQALQSSVVSIVDRDIDLGSAGADSGAAERGSSAAALSREEREVLGLVDGDRTVHEITELTSLGEFDTCRILSDLVTRNLLEESRRGGVSTVGVQTSRIGERLFRGLLYAVVGLLAAATIVTLPANPWSPWRVAGDAAASDQLRSYVAQARLERIERAIQVFYLDAGTFPSELAVLAAGSYLAEDDLVDPWGRDYAYDLGPSGFRLIGWTSDGEPDPTISVTHRFTGLQRMMAPGGVSPVDLE